MALLARHLLHLPGHDLLPHGWENVPAVPQGRDCKGGEPKGKSKGEGYINANHLVHTSKHYWKEEGISVAGGLSTFLKGSRGSLFHVQDEGQRSYTTRYGGQSVAGSREFGSKTQSGKSEREQLRMLGACKGTGTRMVVNKVKKVKLKVPKLDKAVHRRGERERSLPCGDLEPKRGGIGAAFQIALSSVSLMNATNDLKGNFWSASSRSSREIKRNEVLKLANLVVGQGGDPLPLAQETVEGVAACLRGSGMKSGDQYLNELKLLHIEEGHDMPPWLVRTFNLCKKALCRNKGPTKKAVEAKLENISEDLWQRNGSNFPGGINHAVMYAWACVWMLREIEAGACRWEHVRADEQQRQVTLLIPVSKMDQMATGAKRTLQCCGEAVCSRFCAWNLWDRMQKELPNKFKKKGFMFVNAKLERLAKSKMIETWNSATSCRVSGHSARRSGAMEHVRRGMQIQELAFLGRWRSAVVLTYANDALQEVPANKMGWRDGGALDWEPKKSPWTPTPCAQTPAVRAPMTPMVQVQHEPLEVDVLNEPMGTTTSKQALWASSNETRKGKRTWHKVTKAGWTIPMAEWGTACGWNFTKNPDRVSMAVSLHFGQTK